MQPARWCILQAGTRAWTVGWPAWQVPPGLYRNMPTCARVAGRRGAQAFRILSPGGWMTTRRRSLQGLHLRLEWGRSSVPWASKSRLGTLSGGFCLAGMRGPHQCRRRGRPQAADALHEACGPALWVAPAEDSYVFPASLIANAAPEGAVGGAAGRNRDVRLALRGVRLP